MLVLRRPSRPGKSRRSAGGDSSEAVARQLLRTCCGRILTGHAEVFVSTRAQGTVGVVVAAAFLALAVVAAPAADDQSQRLLAAAARGDAAHLAALVREGADPNARDAADPPRAAARRLVRTSRGRARAAACGRRARRRRSLGWTALHQAAASGDLASARLLLDSGATPDLRLARARHRARRGGARRPRRARAVCCGRAGLEARASRSATPCASGPGRATGYCGAVLAVDATRFELRVTEVVGCERGCAADAACSAGRPVGAGGVRPGDEITVPASCLTHTGVER